MSEVKPSPSPILEKITKTLNALDDLNRLIDDLTVKLTTYLLPKADEECKKEVLAEAEKPIAPLEEYLMEILDKIGYLKMKIKQIDSRIR